MLEKYFFMTRLQTFIEDKRFQWIIIGVIVLNSIILGLDTVEYLNNNFNVLINIIDDFCLYFFAIEMLLKVLVYRLSFFKNIWNIIDLMIVSMALVPGDSRLAILRAFRIFRIMRLMTVFPAMRCIVSAMISSIPGATSVVSLLVIVFYITSVMVTNLFGEQFSEFFGTLGRSFYSLFQIMTLESWSMGIVRPVMEFYPYAWLIFIPFIVATSFIVLNLFIGVLVDALATAKEMQEKMEKDIQCEKGKYSNEEIILKLARIENKLESQESKSNTCNFNYQFVYYDNVQYNFKEDKLFNNLT